MTDHLPRNRFCIVPYLTSQHFKLLTDNKAREMLSSVKTVSTVRTNAKGSFFDSIDVQSAS